VNASATRWLAWTAWLAPIAATAIALGQAAANHAATLWILTDLLPQIGCATVGLVVCLRARGNRIGWLFLALGAAVGVGAACDVYAAYGTTLRSVAGVAAHALTALPLVLVPGLVLVFPGGRLHSARWRPAAIAWLAGTAAVVVGFLISPGPMELNADPGLRNPIGVESVVGSAAGYGGLLGIIAVFGVAAVAAAGLVVRFRRATGDERQQLKWFGSAAAAVGVVAVASPALWTAAAPWSTWVVNTAWVAASTTLVVATGIAVLRYRLYEIDVIIRRTLVYTTLVAALAGAYLGGILVIDAALRAITGASGALAVTVSTLVVAGLFQPLRGRIQRIVDRRFYRGKYDAARTLELFSGRLREQIDIDALRGELLAIVGETVQPRRADLWLRALTRDP
jgi:hypothetical protein